MMTDIDRIREALPFIDPSDRETWLRMGMAIKDKLLFLPFTVAVVAAIAWLRWPMPIVMIAGLLLSGGVAYWRLGRK